LIYYSSIVVVACCRPAETINYNLKRISITPFVHSEGEYTRLSKTDTIEIFNSFLNNRIL
jgi:hypothetical protein